MGLLIGEIIVGFLVGEVGDMSVIHNADFFVYIYIHIYIYNAQLLDNGSHGIWSCRIGKSSSDG